jgi:hypothetical protein
MMLREAWRIVDSRTDRPVSICSYNTREQAEREIEFYRDRDARGGRPDCHEFIPYLATRLRRQDDW